MGLLDTLRDAEIGIQRAHEAATRAHRVCEDAAMSSQQPDMTTRLLQELRSATRNYIATLEAGLSALEVPENDPQLATIRTALRVATGARSTGVGYAFGTAINLERC